MRGKIEGAEAGVLRGWAWNEQAPDQRLLLEVHVDGALAGTTTAALRRGDLLAAGIGDGHHGFDFVVPLAWRDGKEHAVNLHLPGDAETVVCKPAQVNFGTQPTTVVGRLEGVKGSRIVGWAWDRLTPENRVELEIFYQGKLIGAATADQYRSDLNASGVGDGAHGFWFAPNAEVFRKAGAKTLEIEVRTSKALGGQKIGEATVTEPVRAASPSKPASKGKPASAEATAKPAKNSTEKKGSVSFAGLSKVSDFIAAAAKAEQEKNFATAVAILREGLKRKPDQFDLLFRFARVLLANGDTAEAREMADRAFKLRPGHEKPAITLARASEVEGQRNLALEYWKFVPPSDSSYAERQIKSSRMMLALERVDEGVECLKAAAQLRPADQTVARGLAQLLEDLSDQEGAAQEWERLAALLPNDARLKAKVLSVRENWQEPERVRIPAQFRGAMRNMAHPVLLAIGDELVDCLAASRLLEGLAAHFEAFITVVVPSMTPAVRLVFDKHPQVRQILVSGEAALPAEIAFVLPEYLMTRADVHVPLARTRFNFVEMRSVKSADPHRRYEDYARWISELSGMSLNQLAPYPRVMAAPAKRVGKTVLFAHTDVRRGAMANELLRRRLLKNAKAAGCDCKLWELRGSGFKSATQAAAKLFAAVSAAAVVVTGSEDVALLALASSTPLIWITSDEHAGLANALSPASLMLLAPHAVDDDGLLLARLRELGIVSPVRPRAAAPGGKSRSAAPSAASSKPAAKATRKGSVVKAASPRAAAAQAVASGKKVPSNPKQSLTKKRAK